MPTGPSTRRCPPPRAHWRGQVKPIGNGLFIDFLRAAQDIIEADPDDRVYYMVSTPPGQFILGNHRLPAPPPIDAPVLGQPYFYDGAMGGGRRRAAGARRGAVSLSYGEADTPQTMLVQVAQRRASREQLARRILFDTALPLSVVIALMSMIVCRHPRRPRAAGAHARPGGGRAPNDLARSSSNRRRARNCMRWPRRSTRCWPRCTRRQRPAPFHQRRGAPAAHAAGGAEEPDRAGAERSQRGRRARAAHAAAARARATRRAAHLVNQLLTLARASRNRRPRRRITRRSAARLAGELTAEWVPRQPASTSASRKTARARRRRCRATRCCCARPSPT